MEKKSKIYKKPIICIAALSDEFMDVMPATKVPLPPGAKEQTDVIEEEVLPEDKNIWEDDEE